MTDSTPQIAGSIHAASIYGQGNVPHEFGGASAPGQHDLDHSADAASISTGIVDSGRSIQPLNRRTPLPPIPDLRFEYSYLASIKGADTWGRVAWITLRDQVRKSPSREKKRAMPFSILCFSWGEMYTYYCTACGPRYSSHSSKERHGRLRFADGSSGTVACTVADARPASRCGSGGGN